MKKVSNQTFKVFGDEKDQFYIFVEISNVNLTVPR